MGWIYFRTMNGPAAELRGIRPIKLIYVKLQLAQTPVKPVCYRDKIFVSAALFHFSVINDDYSIGLPDGGKAVGNYQGSSSFHQFIQRLLHLAFAFAVQRRSGFVQ